MARGRPAVKVEAEIEEFEAANDSDEEEEEDDVEDNPDDYIPPNKLEQCNWARRTIAELSEMMETPWLVLDPDYQRNVVWSNDRMSRLIGSLMSNYYVPPLIFNVKKVATENGSLRYQSTSETGHDKAMLKQRICIDGKQRLSSIKAFVKGEIPCLDNRKRKWWYCEGDGRGKRKLLSDAWKDHFQSLEMLCVEYNELKLEQEEELFARVQMGMELRPAEKLKARSGEWQKFTIEVENQYPDLMAKIDNKRGRAFQTLLTTFKIILTDDDNPVYSTGASTLGPFLEKPQLLDESFKKLVHRIFVAYYKVFKGHPHVFENNNYRHSVKFAPIEFTGVALLIHRHPDRSTGLLAGDIKRMREVLREQRQELRSNSTTFKAIVAYIDNLEQYRGGQGVLPIDEDKQGEPDDPQDGDYEGGREKKPTTPKSNRISLPPPPGTASSSGTRRGTSKGAGKKNNSARNSSTGGSATTSINATRPAVPTFAPPTAPLAYREKERRKQQEQLQQQIEPPSSAPVAPMSRYNNALGDYKLRSSYTGSGGRPEPPYATGANRVAAPTSSSFKAINAPSPFLPDLDADVSYNQRKRRRDGEEFLEDLDLEFTASRRPLYGREQQQGYQDDGDDVVMYGYREMGRSDGRGSNSNGNNNGPRSYSRGGYRGRGGMRGPSSGPGRRVKEERGIGGGRRGPQYGPFTMED
ncbi:hypothetical protein BGX38DRAFT_1269023 [Terfezia claveryi]|nr:hypothetical protein BGX38DRAFT_1269023 [Terfezia claveryi]